MSVMRFRDLDIRDRLADQAMIDRYWSFVVKSDGCWRYRDGGYTGSGTHRYGLFCIRKGVQVGAHRMSWALHNGGFIPAGMVVCHRCDTPSCVRPDHLFLGTQRDNAMDCVQKGRARRSYGEAHLSAKLTEDDVRAIRATPIKYGTRSELARQYGVSLRSITDVLKGARWRHVS